MTTQMKPMTVAEKVAELKLERVVHFTQEKNLYHIISRGGIIPNETLSKNAQVYFDPTDSLRLDGHPDKTCVTFTYPNPFYFDVVKKSRELTGFSDWVLLFIKTDVLSRDGVLFCECNAAVRGGRLLKTGVTGLERCFADLVYPVTQRSPTQDPRAATNLQAEALIPGPIPLTDIIAIATPTKQHAGNARARLETTDINPDQFKWVVSKEMFDKKLLTNAILSGSPVPETNYSHDRKDK